MIAAFKFIHLGLYLIDPDVSQASNPAETWLVYFVMPRAKMHDSTRQARPAHIAPVKVPRQVMVLLVIHDNKVVIRFGHGSNLVLRQWPIRTEASVVRSLIWVSRYSRRNDKLSYLGIIGQSALRQGLKPSIGFLRSITPYENAAPTSPIYRGRFAVVSEEDVGDQQFGRFDRVDLHLHLPDIRSFILHKMSFGIVDSLASQESLPSGEASSQQQQSSSDFRPKKLLVIVGVAVALSGIVRVFKVLNKIYLSTRLNVDMAVCGFFFAGFIVWIGMGIILWALGLL
jgi:hypothetical protein